jgi:hypothetical protein
MCLKPAWMQAYSVPGTGFHGRGRNTRPRFPRDFIGVIAVVYLLSPP